ncbi:MAG TPA: DUF4136 domain-containing protein [Thermoanaerobaculia bacterium]|nr:DUF4136 domain-containing protein [Thermoanaerobaculia bacterium]
MRIRVAVVGVAIAALACTTLTTSVDYDRSLDFSHYRSFAFQKGTPARSELAQKRIEEVIGAALQAKGLTPAGGRSPDLNVVTHVVVEKQQRIETVVWGYGCRWGGGVATTAVTEIPVGTLIIDLVDAERACLVWRGRATDTIGPDSEARERQLQKAVARMLEGFPPK